MEATTTKNKPRRRATNMMLDEALVNEIRHAAIREGYGSRYSPLVEELIREGLARRRRGARESLTY